MKQRAMAIMVLATSIILNSPAYAQGAPDHGAPKSGTGATQGHDEHCCKPDPNDMKGMQGMAGHNHDHAQAPKKPAVKKPAPKPPEAASQNAK